MFRAIIAGCNKVWFKPYLKLVKFLGGSCFERKTNTPVYPAFPDVQLSILLQRFPHQTRAGIDL